MKNKNKPKLKSIPKYSNGGFNKFTKNAGYLGLAIADGAIGEFAPDAIQQDQYNDTKFGKNLGDGVSIKESFDSQSPLAKLRQKVAPYDPKAGMNERQSNYYDQMQPYAKAGSQLGEMWAGSALGAVGGTGGALAKQGVSQGETTPMTPEYKQNPYEQEQTMYARNGGIMDMPNAELEKQEVFETPSGQIDSVDGSSHEQGGVPVNIPNQTKILSDKLKLNGKTFAKLGAKYTTDKEDKILADDKATSSLRATAKLTSEIKQRKIDELFNTQEQMKQVKMNNYAKKLGIDIPQQEFRGGGIFDNESTPYMTADERAKLGYENDLRSANAYGDNYNQNKVIDNGEYTPTDFNSNFTLPSDTTPKESSNIPYSDIISGVANSAGPLYALAKNKKLPDAQFQRPKVKYLDPRAELVSNANSNAGVVRSIKEYSGGNSEQYIRSRIAQGANNSQTNAATINKYDNANADIYNRNQSEVAGISNTEMDYRRKDEAGYRNINRAAVANLGENASGVIRDSKATQQDYKTLGMISSMYPNFQYNQRTGEWKHKQTGEKLSQEEINKATK